MTPQAPFEHHFFELISDKSYDRLEFMLWKALISHAFQEDFKRLGLGEDDARKFIKEIRRLPAYRSVPNLPGVFKLLAKAESGIQLRIYYGVAGKDHLVLLGASEAVSGKPASAADRARMLRRMAALDTVIGPADGEKDDLEVASPADYDATDIQKLRSELGVSQSVFAELIGVSKVLIESWEQGVRTPSSLARRLLEIVSDDPAAFRRKFTRSISRSSKD